MKNVLPCMRAGVISRNERARAMHAGGIYKVLGQLGSAMFTFMMGVVAVCVAGDERMREWV